MSVESNRVGGASGTTAGKPYALVVLLQLHWFIRLRWLFVGAALAVLAVERFVQPAAERPWQLLAVVLVVAASNLLWTLVSRLLHRQLHAAGSDQRVAIRSGQLFASAQIAADLTLLTWILALAGGVENPMSLFYLFHVAISGLLLRTWQAFLLSCWAVLLYALMGVAQLRGWMAHYSFLPELGSIGLYGQPEYVTIVVLVVAGAVFGTLYFTDRIGKILDRREDMLIRMNAALEQSRQAIADLQARRSRFMQTAAHQLKSPLAMVQTLSNLIRDGIVSDEKGIQATCDKIVRRCRDGIAQVTELLALARVQDGDPERHRQAITNVCQVVKEVCQRQQPLAESKQLTFEQQTPQTPLPAHVDATDLADCVGNLIDNAIKYTPEGGRVTVRVLSGADPSAQHELPPPPRSAPGRTHADYVYVIVQDTGIGLGDSVALLEDGTPAAGSIFEAFRRGDAALSAGIPGTGLGLSIVREVVRQAGGYIHVRSKVGEGSTFAVCFPVARTVTSDAETATRQAPAGARGAAGAGGC